jgi:hypothetical protein
VIRPPVVLQLAVEKERAWLGETSAGLQGEHLKWYGKGEWRGLLYVTVKMTKHESRPARSRGLWRNAEYSSQTLPVLRF